jgi:hypothetical protein
LTGNDGWLGFLFILGLLAWFLVPESWTNGVWYGVRYGVNYDQVHTSDKPSDCDWSRSPLGNKGCRFKRIVKAYNKAGEVVGGDDAPRYSLDDNMGKPIVSYDQGKTWAWWPAPFTPDPKIKTVEVRWIKVTD